LKIAVLHPGAMGGSVAAALAANGHVVHWVSDGRSTATRARAKGLVELARLDNVAPLDAIVSVCPPESAHALAAAVMTTGFGGIYVDANAISPATAREVGALVEPRATFVDGGIIGPPAHRPGTTRLYLSGTKAGEVAGWFHGSALDGRAIGSDIGAASALKMAYAAWTKGSSALLLAVCALAAEQGVSGALAKEWAISQRGLAERTERTAHGTAPKAWRFVGEMEEIAATFAAAGLPSGFHDAAAALYARLAEFKDRDDVDLAAVVARLTQSDDG